MSLENVTNVNGNFDDSENVTLALTDATKMMISRAYLCGVEDSQSGTVVSSSEAAVNRVWETIAATKEQDQGR